MMTSKVANLPKILPFPRSGNPFPGSSPAPSPQGDDGGPSHQPGGVLSRLVPPQRHSQSESGSHPDNKEGKEKPKPPKPLGVQDCLTQMMDFVKKHKLQRIIGDGWSDQELERHLRPQAETATQSPVKLGRISPELVMHLAVMSLYDLAVLIDDSTSMEFEQKGKRKNALKEVLHFLADLYGAVSDGMRGIKAIRFLNGVDDLNADHLRRKGEINKVIDGHEFEGLTRIGTGLMQKVLEPFVFTDEPGIPRKLRQMERPLLIMIITDGAVGGEPDGWLEESIKGVVDSLEKKCIGTKAVVFQFARVGDDEDAEIFLRKLHDESSVKDYVDTLSGSDLIELMDLQNGGRKDYTENDQRKLIKLLLGPISPIYGNLEERIDRDNIDVADDFIEEDE